MPPDPVLPLRSPARILAPAGLILALVALVLVVGGEPASQNGVTATPRATAAAKPSARRSYVVRAGDTLSVVAQRHGTTVEDITLVNPGLDPQAIQPGTRLRLPR